MTVVPAAIIRSGLRYPLANLVLGGLFVAALLVVGYRLGPAVSLDGERATVTVSDAEVCLREGISTYFNVTFGTEEYLRRLGEQDVAQQRMSTAQAFVLNANSHVGSIRDLSLDDRVYLRGPDGVVYPSVGKAVGSTTHHNTWLVYFPRYSNQGEPLFEATTGGFDVLIRGVGDYPERVFRFRYPLPVPQQQASVPLGQIAMLAGAAMAALLITCTPCLVGSLTLGTMAMGSAWDLQARRAAGQVRAEMARKTVYYLVALAAVYGAVAVVVNAFRLTPGQLRPVEAIGGLLLLVLGINLLRGWGPAAGLEAAAARLLVRAVPRSRSYVQEGSPRPSFGADASSAMGASLALVCSVAGAPTLATAIILPLMVYAGLSDLHWSMLVLAVYLAVCAVPFFFISIGLGEVLLRLSLRLRQGLMVVNALLLVGLGLLLLVEPASVADALSAPTRLFLEPMRWIL